MSRRPEARRQVSYLPRAVLAMLAVLAMPSWAAATALPTASVKVAPAAWIAYAEQASRTLSTWLSGDEPTAQRLRGYLDRMRPSPDQPPPPVQLSIWIGADGTLTRVEGALFTDPQPQADLHTLLVGRRLPARPPADMLQPVRIQLRLEAAPANSPPATGGGKPPSA